MNLLGSVNDVRAVEIVREYDPGFLLPTEIVYGPLIEYLTGPLGYVEFDLQEQPERMTSNYLLEQNWAQKPTLFTFPYDWRRANASHVETLHQYISKIRQLHDGARVDVIAHSMGNRGLLRALQRIAANAETRGKVKFGQIFLAAPDVDRDLFLDLADLYHEHSERTTLYASHGDIAVHLSAKLHKALAKNSPPNQPPRASVRFSRNAGNRELALNG